MAKSRNPAEVKAAKAEAKAARKAASKQRRSQLWQAFQIQRKEDKRLIPYMAGAFVLIAGASVAAGIYAGGFTMFMLIPLGIVLGALVEISALAWSPSPEMRAFLVVGVMGAFTTFSTFSLDAVTLMERGDVAPAAGYVLGSVVLCVLGFWAGLALFRQVL